MKNKTFSLLAVFAMVVVLTAALASAALTLTPANFVATNVTVSFGTESVSLNVFLNATTSNYQNLAWFGTSSFGTWSLPSVINLDASGGPNSITVTPTLNIPSGFSGNITSTLNVTDSVVGDTTLISITVYVAGGPTELSECSTTGNSNFIVLDLETPDIASGFGEDNDWYPLDEVEITVNVDNRAGEDLNNIALGWGLYDLDDQSFIIDDEEKDFDLDKGDDQDVTIAFKLEDPSDFEDGHSLAFLVWANGQGKDTDIEACSSTINDDVDVQIDEFVLLDNFQYPSTVQCGEDVTISADLWNVGDEDQELVYILVTNKDFGLDQERIDFGDVDAFDNFDMRFNFQIPLDAEQKSYPLTFEVYSEDLGGIYENDLNDDESRYVVPVTVSGGCIVQSSLAVSANIQSGGNAGESLVVGYNITNVGKKTVTYTLTPSGYNLWADAADLSMTSITLNPGQSREVTATIQVKATAKGNQRFEIEVLSGNELVMTQPVTVFIEGKGLLTRITGGNSSLLLIALANVALLVGIIVVVVRIFRK